MSTDPLSQSEAPQAAPESPADSHAAQDSRRIARRHLIGLTIAAVPTILTITANSASAQGPSNQPSPGCESLTPDDCP